MVTNRLRCSAAGVVLLLAATAAHAAGDAVAGKAKTMICQACHGPDGNSPPNPSWNNITTEDLSRPSGNQSKLIASPIWPKLAGQHAAYLVKQLSDLKAGRRKDPIMSGMVGGLSQTDIEDIAAYFSGQKAKPGGTAAEQQAMTHGETLYRTGRPAAKIPACAGCHGPDAHGTPTLPRLAGQHAIYIQKQLWFFKLGKRGSDLMQPIAEQLTAQDIKALSQYLTTRE